MWYLHRLEECIFGLCIPVASFGCKHSFGANTVQWQKVDQDFRKFVFLALYWLTWDGVVCRYAQVSADFFTNYTNAFLDSPYLYLPFDVSIPLVQTRYHGER